MTEAWAFEKTIEAQAVVWFQEAADAGDPQGAFWLADCYRDGEVVKQDLVKARRLYEVAVAGGWETVFGGSARTSLNGFGPLGRGPRRS